MDVLLRTSVSPRSLVPSVEAVVHELDAELPLTRLRTLDEVVGRSISEPRFYATLLWVPSPRSRCSWPPSASSA